MLQISLSRFGEHLHNVAWRRLVGCQRISDLRRYLGRSGPGKYAIPSQLAQMRRRHILAHTRHGTPKLVDPTWAAQQLPKHQDLPFAASMDGVTAIPAAVPSEPLSRDTHPHWYGSPYYTAPASAFFRMPMICSFVNCFRFVSSLRRGSVSADACRQTGK